MPDVQQNTLYLTTPGSYVARDHLTLQVEIPVYPDNLPPDQRARETATGSRKVSIPIHHLESICLFGASTISPPALDLCWEQGVAVNYLNEQGRLHARLTGVLRGRRPACSRLMDHRRLAKNTGNAQGLR
ncbi:MAG TPA: CRISPR-associated endonuclease Cas1 [Verrucomicrobiota bacterium]|nr:hypothetical protein [Verrucomicrobiales bacterium]HRI13114.1 CRISPR-associated endonuclease Cas1 [Verrucomicrobiota bacterium]